MATSAKKENRWKRNVQATNDSESARRRELEAATMVRGPRKPAIPPPPSARRRDVRLWMRENAAHFTSATELAEAANSVFRLPDGGLNDENHWAWDEAIEAIPGE